MDTNGDENGSNNEEQAFHKSIREQIIFLLLFLLLYFASFVLLRYFKRNGRDDYYSIDEDEVTVYRISTWLCTFSLAVSLGAVLLLPISIISNEVLIIYPRSYYIQWLNSSLIQGLWSYIFLFSNLALFVLLPFAYLFTESEGFYGHHKGLMARVYETSTVLTLLGLVVLGIIYVISAIIDKNNSAFHTILNLWSDYLPFLYSCISFLGVIILLACTPLGFVQLFDIVNLYLIKPKFLYDINEEYYACKLEEESLHRRLTHLQVAQGTKIATYTEKRNNKKNERKNKLLSSSSAPKDILTKKTFKLQNVLKDLECKRSKLNTQRHTSFLRRNVLHPLAILMLIGLTGMAVLLVIQNTLLLLIGIKALPMSSKQFTFGVSSLSKLGPVGAVMEIVLTLYLIASSSIGLYTVPVMLKLRPIKKLTSFSVIIVNCAVILILSSALPLLSKILGITNFDLLGDFGSVKWLGNMNIVLLYNFLFAAAATICIMNKFTVRVRRELYARLVENYMYVINISVTFLY